MEPITADTLKAFLHELGESFPSQSSIYLLGGSALLLLGSPRQTLDIDYTTDPGQTKQKELEENLKSIAAQYSLDVESVPIGEFIPLPTGSENRRKFVGKFGNLDVYLFDLYSIALSKIARGFETDFEDVIFLIKNNYIDQAELQDLFQQILPLAPKADIVPREFQQSMKDLLIRLHDQP
jgi:hypothetical protein